MKALSIRQPWAFAITMGCKPVENRDWPTRFRGPVLIHTGKREETDDIDYVLDLMAKVSGETREAIGSGYRNHRALGAIVGAARLVDCVTHMDSPWFNGPYGFVFEKPLWCNIVPCRGQLGFFDVPADVLRDIHCPPYVDIAP
jgi:hypothetical protein